jgi:hypothetical protein
MRRVRPGADGKSTTFRRQPPRLAHQPLDRRPRCRRRRERCPAPPTGPGRQGFPIESRRAEEAGCSSSSARCRACEPESLVVPRVIVRLRDAEPTVPRSRSGRQADAAWQADPIVSSQSGCSRPRRSQAQRTHPAPATLPRRPPTSSIAWILRPSSNRHARMAARNPRDTTTSEMDSPERIHRIRQYTVHDHRVGRQAA